MHPHEMRQPARKTLLCMAWTRTQMASKKPAGLVRLLGPPASYTKGRPQSGHLFDSIGTCSPQRGQSRAFRIHLRFAKMIAIADAAPAGIANQPKGWNAIGPV